MKLFLFGATRRLVVLALGFLLAACSSTYSVDRLLTDETSQPVLGKQIAGLLIEENGRYAMSKDGEVRIIELVFRNGRYESADPAGPGFAAVSFHPVAGSPDLHLVELHAESKPRKTYGIGRQFGARYLFDDFVIDKPTQAVVKANDLAVKIVSGSAVVKTRAALLDLTRLYTQIHAKSLSKPTGFDGSVRLAATPAERKELALISAQLSCLARAGHPHDPAVQKLGGKFSRGVPMGKIDVAKAGPICEQAVALGGDLSVRYTALRVAFQNKRYKEVVPELDKLIAQNFVLAAVMKADLLGAGVLGKKDPEAGRALLRSFAQNGSTVAKYYLGYSYALSRNGPLDYAEARAQMESLLARETFAPAQVFLGDLYLKGLGGDTDLAGARGLYSQAAEAGDAGGQFALAKVYYFGSGVKKDHKLAFDWFSKAAAQDVNGARYIAGFMLARGQGVKKNESRARTMLKPAAEGGYNAARTEYGRLLYLGLGGKANVKLGRQYLQLAADSGSKTAAEYLKQKPATEEASKAKSSTKSGSAAGKPTARTAADFKNVPAARKPELDALLAKKKSFQLTAQNLAFFGGLGSGMLRQCGAPSKASAKLAMQKFVLTSANGSMLGTMYSDKNMSKAWASAAQQQTLFSTGASVGEQIPCSQAERASTGILQALQASSRGADGGLSTFVKSCQSSFDQRRCQCLGDTGRTVMPDIHKRVYNRRIIKSIIDRNPFIGLQIAMTCQIGNY